MRGFGAGWQPRIGAAWGSAAAVVAAVSMALLGAFVILPAAASATAPGASAAGPGRTILAKTEAHSATQGGSCDAFSGAYQLPGSNGIVPAAFTNGSLVVPACGPRPGTGGGPDVYPYPGSLPTPGYQCVEFAERYLYYAYGVTMGIRTNGDQVVAHYASKYKSVFTAIPNGTANQAPVEGDVLSFSTSSSFNSASDGHTAVVQSSSVNSSGKGTLAIVEENAASSGVKVLTVRHWTVLYSGFPYIEWLQSTGATWGKAIEVPGIAALNTGGSADVTSVSCASSGNCGAGGGYTNSKGQDAAFVVSEVNGNWGEAQKVRGAAAAGGITSVSCASPGNCSAGGYSGSQQAFVVSEMNGTWGKAIEVPGAAAPGISESWLQSVSCGSPGNCSAGGMYQTDDGSANEAFVVTQTGGTWGHLREVPGTAALNTGGDAAVTSVSCGSAGNCSAGGSYQDAAGTQAFVASETGGIWGKAVEVPGTAALNTSGYALVQSVSCASAGNCSADGLYSTGTAQEAFVVGQINGTWGTASELQGITSGAVWPASVSCGSPGNCSTGGYYGTADGTDAFVVSETGGTWGTATNVPGTSGTGDEVTTISCGSAGNCSAGGGSTGDQAFVASETYGTWGTATAVRGLGTGGSLLWSVSCPPAGNCAAGGEYANSSGKTQAFVVSESGG